MSLDKYCRVCLYIDDKHVDVLENQDINRKLERCLAITVLRNDNLPKGICTKCVNELCQFYDFQLKAQSSSILLTNMVSSEDTTVKFLSSIEQSQSDDISTIMSYLEENDTSLEVANKLIQGGVKVTKITSMTNEKKQSSPNDEYEIHMEIDVLDSDEDIVRQILMKESSNAQSIIFNDGDNTDYKNKYSCLACKKVFHDISVLTIHMESCKRTCIDCDLLFDSQQKLKQHRLFHRPELDQVCEQCGQSFSDKNNLLQHIQSTHTQADFVTELGCVYRCRQCGELFENRKDLYFHAKKHIQTKKAKTSKCDECGDRFSSKPHKCSNLPPTDVPCVFRCKVCLTLFTDRMKLYSHVKKHCEQGPQLCDHCGKSYPTSTALNRHVLTHVGKTFQCQNCQRNFADNSLLEKHLLLHARSDTFICEICGITFKKQETLFNHMEEKHT